MGKSCPKCSSDVEHDFGVFVCAKCGSVLFVDFDGNVQLSTPETAAGGPPSDSGGAAESLAETPSMEAPSDFQFKMDPIAEAPAGVEVSGENEAPILELVDGIGDSESLAGGSAGEYSIPAEGFATPVSEEPVVGLNPDFNQDLFQSSETTVPEEPQVRASSSGPPPAITDVNFEDVVDYANQIELDNTPLVYTLWIEGIDHKEVREKVIEVLRDIKFNLHLKEIIPTIKGGVLELRDLNPVKTSLIATRLREESVQFRWKQSVYQSEAASGT